MNATYLGEVVLRRRNDLGLTLEMVCEGLCTSMTLSRFEKGMQTPTRDCVEAILQRLGLPDDRYFAQLTRREAKLILLRKEALNLCSQYEHALGEEKQWLRTSALEKLCELERYIKLDDRINQQFILRVKATLGNVSSQRRLELLMEAIRLTSPRFDLDEISNCLYTANEVLIISKIALHYAYCGCRGKAIDIYRQLLEIIQMRTPGHSCLSLIAYNYALQLAWEKRLEEALKISEFGRQACIKQGYYYLLPKFLHIEADSYYFMDESGRSAELYRSAYYIYGATMDERNQRDLKADAEERFGLIF